MQHDEGGVQPIDKRGAWLAVLAIAIAAVFQGMWDFAPHFLETPLWPGASLTLALLLGFLSLVAMVSIAWLMCRADGKGGQS